MHRLIGPESHKTIQLILFKSFSYICLYFLKSRHSNCNIKMGNKMNSCKREIVKRYKKVKWEKMPIPICVKFVSNLSLILAPLQSENCMLCTIFPHAKELSWSLFSRSFGWSKPRSCLYETWWYPCLRYRLVFSTEALNHKNFPVKRKMCVW